MHQCFVICPFGSDSRSPEEKALLVQLEGFDQLVFKKTVSICRKKGYEIKINDSRAIAHGKDDIKGAVQKCIDDAAAVVVILTADKPNVYIELGWAHGMWQAPILLKKAGYPPPADISNDLCIEFKDAHVDGTDPAGARKLAMELADKIIEKIKLGRNAKPFQHWPSTTVARGAVQVYNRFSKAISPLEWSMMIEAAQREIIFASTSMSRILTQAFYTTDAKGTKLKTSLPEMLLKKALDGVDVTILFYHEDNVTLGHLKHLRNDIDAVHRDVKKSVEVWSTQRLSFETTASRAATPTGSFRVVQVRRRHLPFRITLTENRVLATLRLYTEAFNSGLTIDALSQPADHVDPESVPVYTQIRDELQFVIAENSEASEVDYRDWLDGRRRA